MSIVRFSSQSRRFVLTQNEIDVAVTLLYEPGGYLDVSIRISDNQSARTALGLDPTLDVAKWIRDNPQKDEATSKECSLLWVCKFRNDRNTPKPPEGGSFHNFCQQWDDNVADGFARVSQIDRNAESVAQLYDTSGNPTVTMLAGDFLFYQQTMFRKIKKAIASLPDFDWLVGMQFVDVSIEVNQCLSDSFSGPISFV